MSAYLRTLNINFSKKSPWELEASAYGPLKDYTFFGSSKKLFMLLVFKLIILQTYDPMLETKKYFALLATMQKGCY